MPWLAIDISVLVAQLIECRKTGRCHVRLLTVVADHREELFQELWNCDAIEFICSLLPGYGPPDESDSLDCSTESTVEWLSPLRVATHHREYDAFVGALR